MTPRTRVAVMLLGLALSLFSRPALAQETILPRSAEPPESHARAHVMFAAGVALTATSFVFADAADRAYQRYQDDSDPALIQSDYDAAHRDDRISAALLLGGTGALAVGVYWRFIHHARGANEARLGVVPSVTPLHAGLALRVALP